MGGELIAGLDTGSQGGPFGPSFRIEEASFHELSSWVAVRMKSKNEIFIFLAGRKDPFPLVQSYECCLVHYYIQVMCTLREGWHGRTHVTVQSSPIMIHPTTIMATTHCFLQPINSPIVINYLTHTHINTHWEVQRESLCWFSSFFTLCFDIYH